MSPQGTCSSPPVVAYAAAMLAKLGVHLPSSEEGRYEGK
jgi:hypothetical protein